MERSHDAHPRATGPAPAPSTAATVVHDRSWAEDLRRSVCCAGALFGLLLCVDRVAGSLTWWRAGLWLLLALMLRDALGSRVEIDPEVLVRNPDLWHRLDEGARRSEATGSLRCGTSALHRLERRLDRETALAVFRTSGME
ncbi:hypothetical protein JK359_13790 [Streptomyces actinomycinicus]|uniref:Uncharacterized protein n=1 Tax=Streptomyces actinomycinicus TaxID=1695166 RepID=A0A937EIJ5_9ACTN|nr:hypothetical protein [Streptomyces actinomycinicus]MBL1083042.1 hypothetical protein [Streptomyces actinomycinicus]